MRCPGGGPPVLRALAGIAGVVTADRLVDAVDERCRDPAGPRAVRLAPHIPGRRVGRLLSGLRSHESRARSTAKVGGPPIPVPRGAAVVRSWTSLDGLRAHLRRSGPTVWGIPSCTATRAPGGLRRGRHRRRPASVRCCPLVRSTTGILLASSTAIYDSDQVRTAC